MTYITGHYDATYDGSSIGRTKDGFRIIETPHFSGITTDDFGDVEADVVLRGMTVEVELDYVEYSTIKAALYAVEAQGFSSANVGKLGSSVAKTLILTAATGTTAKTYDGAKIYTFTLAVVLTDFTTLLKNNLREGPVRFRILPAANSTSASYTWA